MKKLMLILLAAVLMMAACSKSKTVAPVITLTPQNATIKDVTGKWLATVDSTYTTQNNQTTILVIASTDGTFFQFNADGTGNQGDSADPVGKAYTFNVSDGRIVLHLPASGGSPAQDINVTILAISSSKLGLSFSEGSSTRDIYCIKN